MLRLAPTWQRLQAPEFLALAYVCDYTIVETDQTGARWSVRGLSYRCELYDAEREILAYHWHPFARGDVVFPHLHLSAGARVGNSNLTRAHLPTGSVLLEDVLRLAIDAFGVQPLREDWSELLVASRVMSEEAWKA
jgi:hypothetical protein